MYAVRRRWNRNIPEGYPQFEVLEARLLLDGGGTAVPTDYDPAWVAGAPAGLAALTAGDPGDWTGALDVYVEPGLLADIQAAVNTYVSDLTAEGYTVAVSEWSGTAEALRSHLRARYDTAGLEGALLIGDLPTLLYTNADDFSGTSAFLHDLYFMDLDGEYILSDTEPDRHVDGAGDATPEIYVSRITTSAITALTGETEAGLINRYFDRVHAYRTGGLTYENRGVLWSDDDWQYGEYHLGGDALYEEVLNVRDPQETTRQNYVDTLGLDYESIMFMSHSSATSHSIGGVGSGAVTSAQVLAINPRPAFYNLWNCSAGRFDVAGNLICTYVYGGEYGLNAVGTTKTGSMLGTQHFYAFQGQGMSLGQAFKSWWEAVGVGSDMLKRWLYGMTMQGDPTLRPATMGEPVLTVDAGGGGLIQAGEPVLLDGAGTVYVGSREPIWHWEQVSGPAVEIDGADGRFATFTASETGTYGFRLTVDAGPLAGSDEVTFYTHDPDLLVWWGFDDGEGTGAADRSGNGRAGEVVGATWEEAGRVGGALRFDGDDFVVDGDASAYLNGLDALTVSMWIRADAIGTDRGFLTTRDPAGPDPKDGLLLRYDDEGSNGGGDDVIKAYVQTLADKHRIEGASGTQSTEWQHVALTWSDGEAMALYVDGALQQLTYDQGPLDGATAGAETLQVGLANYEGWLGLIDDVRIYGRAMAAEEIADLANLDPVAAGDAYEVPQNAELAVDGPAGVLDNDEDPDNSPQGLVASLVAGPEHGQLVLRADGSFVYTPAEDFTGTDHFRYRASDGREYSDVAVVTITVRDTILPTVTGVDVSLVSGDIHLGFSEPVSLAKDDLVLLDAAAVPMDLAGASLETSPDGAGAVLSFAARLPAGYYRLLLRSEGIRDAWDNELDGDGDGSAGGDHETVLMVPLRGDATLDGTVDYVDFLGVKWCVGISADAAWSQGDFDGDEDVDRADVALLQANLNRTLPAPAPLPSGLLGLGEETAGAGAAAGDAPAEASPTLIPPAAEDAATTDPAASDPSPVALEVRPGEDLPLLLPPVPRATPAAPGPATPEALVPPPAVEAGRTSFDEPLVDVLRLAQLLPNPL